MKYLFFDHYYVKNKNIVIKVFCTMNNRHFNNIYCIASEIYGNK